MAAAKSAEAPTRPARARGSTKSATPKLRDSCHSCAISKVKCHKEKPTCARCAKRGVTCEYFETKRAGRKHDTRPKQTKGVPQTLPEQSFSTFETSLLTSRNLTQPSPRQHTSTHPEVLPDILATPDLASSSTLTASSFDFDDFLASPISSCAPEMSDFDVLDQPQFDRRSLNSDFLDFDGAATSVIPEDAFSFIGKTVFESPAQSEPQSLPERRDSTNSDGSFFQDFCWESKCCCLLRALDLLKQLSPNASTICMYSRRQDHESTTSPVPTIQSVVAKNDQSIEAINGMLQCPCSGNDYLLTIMSLVVFKVLGWYTAVMNGSQDPTWSHADNRRQPLYHSEQALQSPLIMSGYCIEGEDQCRMVAQLILSGLNRVQRLVNLLSQRLRSHGMRNRATSGLNGATDGQHVFPGGGYPSPFSATMLVQLEADLRKRLGDFGIGSC